MSQDQLITQNQSDLKQKYDLQIIKQKLNSTPPTPKSLQLFLVGFPVPHTSNHSHNSSAKLKAFGVETSLPRRFMAYETELSQSTFTPEKRWHQKIDVSKKSQTGPTERTPKPEYLIALATYLGVRW